MTEGKELLAEMKSTVEIKKILQAASVEELPEFIAAYASDERQGVRKLAETAAKRLAEGDVDTIYGILTEKE